MANTAHLDILQQGVQIWNEWRKKNKDLRIDLREAQLNRFNLSNANLSGALMARAQLKGAKLLRTNLRGAKLTACNLSGADLTGADLYRATLFKSDLARASLMKANLTRANLGKSDLTQAVLSRSDFRGADLKGAQMMGAVVYETVFGDTDLSDTQGLENCQHHGPSTVDHRTINKSNNIPLSFLRGCGLPDEIIGHYQALMAKGLRTHTCLISYAKEDKAFALQLHHDLQDQGIRCWLVPDELKGGQDLQLRTNQALGQHGKLVLILSDSSMASDWVAAELKGMRELEKQERRRMLFPVSLASPPMLQSWTLMEPGSFINLAKELRQYPIPNFSDMHHEPSYESALVQLLRDLKSPFHHPRSNNLGPDVTGELENKLY
ncbi:MAG: toll/interleukin-1 receptor domain-containing protein [Bacteroidota bacterium]